MADSSKSKGKSRDTSARPKESTIKQDSMHNDEALNHDVEQTIQNTVKSDIEEKPNKQYKQNIPTTHMMWILLPISGLLGGIITLALWGGLQWAGFLSPSFVENHAQEQKALQIAKTVENQSEETREQLKNVLQEIDALKTDLSSFSSQRVATTQSNEASQKENKQAFAALEKKVNELEEYVNTLIEVSKNMEKAISVGQENRNDLAVLKKQVETMQEKVTAQNDKAKEKNTALFIAISSLKNAVERGGSYSNELKTLQQLLPSMDGLELLQKTASIGLPSSAQLAADFAHVADDIVATQNIVASNASFFERILAWVKGLVISRPIGNVEGTTLGAITARMEVAIQMGDYEKALSEWKTLPQSAKDVSVDFIYQLETHMAVQRSLQQLLLSVQQGSVKATKM
ncbi:COG4223 family protein [Bartonella raoultii]|uniref:Uncharacterized protein n=1 Tax=Bartonella raoultii TaxID=1457020 RepID=A0ABS7I8H6_9HYPH|nr:hypothetical protein [Bartonella raoultii]MBX4335952.1 hypothetical protein [Bartonella raoultii]